MAIPEFSMRQLLEAGVHFGHQSHRWNPKMADYIFGARNNIHIIDLAQTVPLLHRALQAVSDTVAKGGRILFVGTKRQAQDGVAEAAKRSAQYFVNSRWPGGTLTNRPSVAGSIKRPRPAETILASGRGGKGPEQPRRALEAQRDSPRRPAWARRVGLEDGLGREPIGVWGCVGGLDDQRVGPDEWHPAELRLKSRHAERVGIESLRPEPSAADLEPLGQVRA